MLRAVTGGVDELDHTTLRVLTAVRDSRGAYAC